MRERDVEHLLGDLLPGERRLHVEVLCGIKHLRDRVRDRHLRFRGLAAADRGVRLRWERLLNRFNTHQRCVDDVEAVLRHVGITDYVKVGREELHRGLIQGKDLVIAVGGDGTILNTSSFVDDTIPVLGVNPDPTRPEEHLSSNNITKGDERRSRGALCAISANNLKTQLPRILYGDVAPGRRSRIQCLVRSAYTETRLPPALNDILVAHPLPAAVSRFRLTLCHGNVQPSHKTDVKFDEVLQYYTTIIHTLLTLFLFVLIIVPFFLKAFFLKCLVKRNLVKYVFV